MGEGGLPDGARQFSNFLKVQRDWVALGKTVNEKKAGVSDEEWKNIALFLRKVYQVGNMNGVPWFEASFSAAIACPVYES